MTKVVTNNRAWNSVLDLNSDSKPATMEQFRRGLLGKATAFLTSFLFTFVFYLSPTGSVVANEISQDEIRQQQIETVLENTPEKKLAHRLNKVKNKVLKEWPAAKAQREQNRSLLDNISNFFSGDQVLTDSELLELESLRAAIQEAYAGAEVSFAAVEQKLQNKNVPAVGLQRQQSALATFNQSLLDFNNLVDAVISAQDTELQQQALDALADFMGQQKFQRRHTIDDPNQLPFGTPSSDVRKPFTDEAQLQSYLGVDDPYARYPQFAAIGVTQDMLDAAFAKNGGPTEDDLAETPEVQLTDAIRAKAEELNHDPITIYTWVHNNIRYIPSYGSIQGADFTLQTLRGNATDTASLLIALLRASNIPARYAYGVVDIPIDQAMNWLGGVETPFAAGNLTGQGGIPGLLMSAGGSITTMRQEHTWVEAYVDFEPSRGVKLHNLDNWIPMDASFKQYEFTEGYNLEENVPFDAQPLIDDINASTTINETEGWVQNVPQQVVETQLADFQQQLEDYVANQNPDATVGEVLGLQEITIIEPGPLAAGLPYQVVVKQQNYSEVPDNQRHKFQYKLSLTGSFGHATSTLIDLTQNTSQLAGKKLALSFNPATADDEAIIESYLPEPDPVTGEIDPNLLPDTLPGYLIHLTAQFTQDGQTLQSGAAGTMGSELHEKLGLYNPAKGWRTSVNHPVAGEYRAIGLDLQGTSPEQALRLQQDIESTQAKLESEDSAQLATLTKHDVIGDLIYSTMFSYFALNNVQDEIAQQSANIVSYRAPSYGIFNTGLETSYFFGVPRNVRFSGLSMDVDLVTHQTVDKQNNTDNWVAYNRATGSRYSAMEHLVPEQMFSTDEAPAQGISAVKALALAAAEGQRIYTITQDNLATSLSQIQLGSGSEQEIINAVYAGKIVTTHQYQLNFQGWIGEGYIIMDPQTGSGAYKIAGGGNGSLTTFAKEVKGTLKKLMMRLQFYIGSILSLQSSNILARFIIKSLGLLAATLFDFYKIFSKCSGSTAVGITLVTFFIALSIAIMLFFSSGGVGIVIIALALPALQNLLVNYLIEGHC